MRQKIITLLTLICILFSMCTVAVGAADEYTPIVSEVYGGHTYQLFDESMAWEDAMQYCSSLGGHLVTISTEKEQAFISDFITNGTKDFYWMGASDTHMEGTWEWVTGEAWNYHNWCENNPDNYQNMEHYLGIIRVQAQWDMRIGTVNSWNDFSEKDIDQMGFICEWDHVYSSFGSEVSEWASDEIEEAYDKELIPDILVGEDLTQPITRAEFAAVSVKTYELMANTETLPAVNNPFTDTNDVEVLKAYNTGITKGVSATEFNPDAFLNREQAATMLTRVFKRATIKGWTIEEDAQFVLEYQKPAAFADDSKISDWAKDSVYFMVANHIINGVGDNKFAPQNSTSEEEATGYANATREQALIIATRMVENLK